MKKHSKHNPVLLLLIFFLSTTFISSQQLTPSVISTSGGFYTNASGMLSFTTGEMSAVETYNSPTNTLTQGFQQVWELGTGINENQDPPFSFSIYPNPSDGHFNLVTENKSNAHADIRMIDLLGREVQHIAFDQESNIHVQSIDLSDIAQGMYLMTITMKDKRSASPTLHIIEKIQIVK